MTVKELIDFLQQVPPNFEVVLMNPEYGETAPAEPGDFWARPDKPILQIG